MRAIRLITPFSLAVDNGSLADGEAFERLQRDLRKEISDDINKDIKENGYACIDSKGKIGVLLTSGDFLVEISLSRLIEEELIEDGNDAAYFQDLASYFERLAKRLKRKRVVKC